MTTDSSCQCFGCRACCWYFLLCTFHGKYLLGVVLVRITVLSASRTIREPTALHGSVFIALRLYKACECLVPESAPSKFWFILPPSRLLHTILRDNFLLSNLAFGEVEAGKSRPQWSRTLVWSSLLNSCFLLQIQSKCDGIKMTQNLLGSLINQAFTSTAQPESYRAVSPRIVPIALRVASRKRKTPNMFPWKARIRNVSSKLNIRITSS